MNKRKFKIGDKVILIAHIIDKPDAEGFLRIQIDSYDKAGHPLKLSERYRTHISQVAAMGKPQAARAETEGDAGQRIATVRFDGSNGSMSVEELARLIKAELGIKSEPLLRKLGPESYSGDNSRTGK